MNVLAIDIGGTRVNVLATGQNERRAFESSLGAGNVKKLKKLPEGCRGGDNVDAFLGGFRLWKDHRLPRGAQRKALSPIRKKFSPHPNQKTPSIEKDTTKGAAA